MRFSLSPRRSAALLIIGFCSLSALAQFDRQPAKEHSGLYANDGAVIRDDAFAQWVKDLLIKDGKTNAKDAKFIFNQCYGGGMLDDIETQLGNIVPWVGGSAAKHNEVAKAQLTTKERKYDGDLGKLFNSDRPLSFWTTALLPELAKDQTLETALKKARENDILGVNITKKNKELLTKQKLTPETGQYFSANGGDKITLGDKDAKSHHAILWAGQANLMRHFYNISDTRDAIAKAWKGTDFTITVLFGNGKKRPDGKDLPKEWEAKPGLAKTLRETIAGLKDKMNKDEQFLFYASDHGTNDVKMQLNPYKIIRGVTDSAPLDINEGVYEGLISQEDNIPTLTIDYEGLFGDKPLNVLLNDSLIGQLLPGETEAILNVPEDLLSLGTNIVSINNDSDYDVTLNTKDFSTGGIDDQPIPEPATAMLLVFAAILVRRSRNG